MNDWMPPLPEPDVIVHYTADQMRAHGQACARAALEQARVVLQLVWTRNARDILMTVKELRQCDSALRAIAELKP